MRGMNLSATFRRGDGTTYKTRPAANRIAARAAWDYFAETGPIEWIQLLDGYWGCSRPGNPVIEEEESIHFRRKWWL